MPDPDDTRRDPAGRTRPAGVTVAEPAHDDNVVFHGHAGTPAFVTIETDGGVAGLLRHHVRHSPGGFQWGYRGSGPHELARCLLAAALGEDAYCGRCMGAGVVPAGIYNQDHVGPVPTKPCRCGDGIAVPVDVYGPFVDEVVAHWRLGRDWQITAGEIRRWIARHYGTTP